MNKSSYNTEDLDNLFVGRNEIESRFKALEKRLDRSRDNLNREHDSILHIIDENTKMARWIVGIILSTAALILSIIGLIFMVMEFVLKT